MVKVYFSPATKMLVTPVGKGQGRFTVTSGGQMPVRKGSYLLKEELGLAP